MTQITDPNRPLKVCHTCRHWLYRYKGLCERLGQGVGKFWHCEDWVAPAGKATKPGNPEKAA
jgi:hypothetical protein